MKAMSESGAILESQMAHDQEAPGFQPGFQPGEASRLR